MASGNSTKGYPCADCRKTIPAMKLFSAQWDDLAYSQPETIEEALHKRKETGISYTKICMDCELVRRQKEDGQDPSLLNSPVTPNINVNSVTVEEVHDIRGAKSIAEGKSEYGGSVTSDAAAEGWAVVGVSRGSKPRSSSVTQKKEEELSLATVTSPAIESTDFDEGVDANDPPEPPKHPWASMAAIRQEMIEQKRGQRNHFAGADHQRFEGEAHRD